MKSPSIELLRMECISHLAIHMFVCISELAITYVSTAKCIRMSVPPLALSDVCTYVSHRASCYTCMYVRSSFPNVCSPLFVMQAMCIVHSSNSFFSSQFQGHEISHGCWSLLTLRCVFPQSITIRDSASKEQKGHHSFLFFGQVCIWISNRRSLLKCAHFDGTQNLFTKIDVSNRFADKPKTLNKP